MTPTEQAAAQRCADLSNAEELSGNNGWEAKYFFCEGHGSAYEAFRKYVARTSEIVEDIRACLDHHGIATSGKLCDDLATLILPKPVDHATAILDQMGLVDPDWHGAPMEAAKFRKVLANLGLKIVEAGDE